MGSGTLAGFDTKRPAPWSFFVSASRHVCWQTRLPADTHVCSGAARNGSQPVMTVSTIR